MGNCLVTKLKESVNADFPVLGELIIYIEVTSSTPADLRHLTIKTGEPISSNVYIRTLDDSEKLSLNSDFSNPSNKIIPNRPSLGQDINIYLLEGTYAIAISHKYELYRFIAAASASNPGVVRNMKFSDFEYTKLDYFNVLYNPYIVDSLDNVPGTIIRLNATGDRNITGNIQDLSKLVNALAIRLYQSQVTGTIESLCEGILGNSENPRTETQNMLVDVRLTAATLGQSNPSVPTEELTVTFTKSSESLTNYDGCVIKNGSNITVATCIYSGGTFTWTY